MIRNYDPERDREAAHRIWREIGWLKKDKEAEMDRHVGCGRALVAEVNGEAECLVLTAPGTVRHLREDLRFIGVTGVATSRVARRLGLAKRVTARALAADAADGALVAGLDMFEQGYYNQVGFGTGGYEHLASFDPSLLNVSVRPRVPRRITAEDWESVHANRLARLRGHGSVNLTCPDLSRAEMAGENAFGLGYFDGPAGELTHHFWCEPKEVENGPYYILWMAFQTRAQLLELLALIKGLGDQVRQVQVFEPLGIQIQDLLERPFKNQQLTQRSEYQQGIRAEAHWQMRSSICLPA